MGVSNLFGVTPHQPEMTDAQLYTLAQVGASTVRVTSAFPGAGGASFNTMDGRVEAAARQGLRVVIGIGLKNYDTSFYDVGGGMEGLVARYKANGGFWQANPQLTYRPVTYILGNEPNLAARPFNGTQAQFAEMTNGCADAAKRIDPGAILFSAGLAAAGGSGYNYLSGLLKLIDKTKLTGAAYHPYDTNPDTSLAQVQQVRNRLVYNQWSSAQILIDEIAYKHASIGLVTQAAYLTKFFNSMSYHRVSWNITRVLWYGYIDVDTPIGSAYDVTGGLWNSNGTKKPSWDAFKKLGAGARWSSRRPSTRRQARAWHPRHSACPCALWNRLLLVALRRLGDIRTYSRGGWTEPPRTPPTTTTRPGGRGADVSMTLRKASPKKPQRCLRSAYTPERSLSSAMSRRRRAPIRLWGGSGPAPWPVRSDAVARS
jgi:hypothetical protein